MKVNIFGVVIPGILILAVWSSPPKHSKGGDDGFALRQDLFKADSTRSPIEPHAASLVELPDGDILYSFNAKHSEGPIVKTRWGHRSANRVFLSRMESGQERWTEPGVFARDDSVEIHNTILWSDNEALFMFYTTMEGLEHGASTLDMIISKDGGQTWSEPRVIQKEWGWMFGTSPLRMSNGEVMVPVYKENSPNGVGFMISDDGFETWEFYPSDDPAEWPKPGIMAAVVELHAGELLAYIRSSEQILEIRSSDYGWTWSDPVETDLPNPWARVALIKSDSGNLVMAHNPTSGSNRTPLRLSLSEDHGKTWPFWVDVETDPEGRYDYPYLIQSSDGRIHLGYTHNHKTTMRHIVFDEAFVTSGQSFMSREEYSIARFENGEFTITDL